MALQNNISRVPLRKIAKSRVPFKITIPNLAPLFLQNPESRPSNKPNPGSRKTYWGPSKTTDSLPGRYQTAIGLRGWAIVNQSEKIDRKLNFINKRLVPIIRRGQINAGSRRAIFKKAPWAFNLENNVSLC